MRVKRQAESAHRPSAAPRSAGARPGIRHASADGTGTERSPAGGYSDEYYVARHISRPFRREIEHLSRLVRGGGDGALLEVGCGGGAFLHVSVEEGRSVVGLDNNLQALRLAQRTAPSAAVVLGDAANLPFKDGAFSRLVAQHLIEHFDQPEVAVGEWRRVLAPGGMMAAATPNRAYADPAIYDDPTHRHIFSKKSLRHLLVRRGFSVERCYTVMPFLATRRLTSILSSRFGVFRFLPFLADRGSTLVLRARKVHQAWPVDEPSQAAGLGRGQLRLAILVHELLDQGGCERQALCLARELQAFGHQVTVYTCRLSPRCYPKLVDSLAVIAAGRHPLSHAPLPGRLRAWLDMQHLARAVGEPTDVLNPHGWPAHWAALSAARRLACRPPVVWMCNDYVWPLPSKPGRQMVNPARGLWRSLVRRYDGALTHAIDRVAVLSEMGERHVGTGYGVSTTVVRSGSTVSAGQGVEDADSADLRRLGAPKNAFLILFVGIFMPHRRLEDVLRALAAPSLRHRTVHLLVVGEPGQYPAYARQLADLARELDLSDRVTWAGGVPEAELPHYYRAADAFVFPNEEQTWGLAVTEAIACGKPAIVSTGCGVSEILTDGVDALLVPPRRPDLIAQRLAWIMDNPQDAATLAEAGRRLVTETLSWTRYAQSMLGLFEEALSSRDAMQPATGAVAGQREAVDA